MKTSKLFTALIISTLLMTPVMLSAQQITNERQVSAFTKVSASSLFNVFLTQAEEYSLKVEAPADLQEYIETSVSNSTLNIDFTTRDRRIGDEKLNIFVSAPVFLKLSASGAGSFTSEGLLSSPSLEITSGGAGRFSLEVDVELLTTKLTGASNVSLKGKATKHLMEITGASNVSAFDLETDVSEARVTGVANVELKANHVLDINTSGTSHVVYKGTPEAKTLNATGLAEIKGLDDGESMTNTSVNDTTIVRIGKREMVIIDGHPEKVSRTESSANFRDNWSGLELGVNGYLTTENSMSLDAEDEYMDLLYNKSIAVNLNLWQQNLVLVRNRLALVTGLGVSWNNYRFSNDVKLIKGIEMVEPVWEEESYRKTKLTVSYLNVPLMLEFQTPSGHGINSFHMSAGLNVGLKLRSHTKQVYDVDGEKNKDKDFKDFYINPFRYDATARIGWGSINLFASYSLNTLFKDDKGPELHPFSVGIRIVNL